jgi:hypothetical protein
MSRFEMGMVLQVGKEVPVQVELGPTARHQARAGENVPRAARLRLVTCR